MYPEQLVAPMRNDLTSAGFAELKSSEEVDNYLKDKKGTTLLVINSVCGCAAGAARPGVKWALILLVLIKKLYQKQENILFLILHLLLRSLFSKMVNLFTLLNVITLKEEMHK
jgi:hypothetical protein